MNNLPYVTIVGWETRNWRHREKALGWCKDYGFKPITRHVFIGELYTKEHTEMQAKFKEIFSKKTEKFFFATMCKSCFNETMSGVVIKEKIPEIPTFELIQIPENVVK
jgi:CRISPR/Cas system-associated endoribonuclease Cas2